VALHDSGGKVTYRSYPATPKGEGRSGPEGPARPGWL